MSRFHTHHCLQFFSKKKNKKIVIIQHRCTKLLYVRAKIPRPKTKMVSTQ